MNYVDIVCSFLLSLFVHVAAMCLREIFS